jgi:Flp pilus assembly protein TadG
MRSLFKSLLRLARCSSGNALVEMTIVVPVAISLMAGGVDFALALTTQATGSKSVRDAARFLGSLRWAGGVPCSWPTVTVGGLSLSATDAAKNLAVYGQLSTGTTPLIAGWQTSDVSNPSCVLDTTTNTYVITLSATFPYNSLIVASFLPIASTYTLRTQHSEPQLGGT